MHAVASVAAAAAITYAVIASAETCDYSVVGPTLQGLADPLTECMSATGYNVANYTSTPTDEQKESVCSDCSSLIDALNALTWPDCTMELGDVNETLTQYFANIIGQCDTAGSQYTSVLVADASASSETEVGSGSTAAGSTAAGSTAGSAATVGSSSSASTADTPGSASASSTGGAVTVTVSAAALVACSLAALAL